MNKFIILSILSVIETSGRLHFSWHQNKRLRMPWTTDWMHTGQDRRIQTELAFTLAKNATKPNPFEIISLQTTRKENNWKTEETLARAVVTLETERIKGSNRWCLWWWWWWWCLFCLKAIVADWKPRAAPCPPVNPHDTTRQYTFLSNHLKTESS